MWQPKVVGTGFDFTIPTKPLEPFRDYVTMLSGLDANRPSGSQMLAGCMWLNPTAPFLHDTANLPQDNPLDPRIAAKNGQDPPPPSLAVANEEERGKAGC